MRFLIGDHGKLKRLFIRAYHERETPELDELWQMRVMSHIRRLGPLSSRRGFWTLFEQSVWRLAPVMCLLILVLVAFLLTLDIRPDDELAQLFVNDPIRFTLVQWFGV